MFAHAVVAILVELSVLARIVELIRGCDEKVVTPLNMEVEVPVPKVSDPPDKLVPIVISEVAELAFMIFTVRVEAFRSDTFVVPNIVVEAFSEPTIRVPPDKLDPMDMIAFA